MGGPRERILRGGSLSIGRGDDNDLVLNDDLKTLSRRHCRIDFVDGEYLITDLSTNGTFLNGSSTPIGFSSQRRLGPGDRLELGEFVIHVGEDGGGVAARPPPIFDGPLIFDDDDEEDSGVALPGPDFEDPPLITPGDDVDQTSGKLSQQRSELERILVAAGLDPLEARTASSAPALPETLGEILGILVAGMIDVLRTRATIKREFRIDHTQVSTGENNPLKLEPLAEGALRTLFLEQRPGFLPSVEAVRQGFDDIRAHEEAMLAGIQAAFDSMLRQLDPAELRQRFDRQGKGAVILASRKSYYWDQLEQLHAELREDSYRSFMRLFGEEFGRAYEQRMQSPAWRRGHQTTAGGRGQQ
jgi:predicted component of type VI protein secretion system